MEPTQGGLFAQVAHALRTTFRGTCPACNEGRQLEKWNRVHPHCPACKIELRPGSGSHYGGPMVIGYTLGALVAFATGALIYLFAGVPSYIEIAMLAPAVPVALLGYHYGQTFWTWLLWRTGVIT